MKRTCILLAALLFALSLRAQGNREFAADTATFIEELVAFTGVALQSNEQPDFDRFLRLFDSLSYDRQMEIIKISNLMIKRSCRPRPQFITYQRVMIEFFSEDKTGHGYDDWFEGYTRFLESDEALLRTINQWLSLTLSLLQDNIFYTTNNITWKVSTPAFHFRTEETMKVEFEDVTVACYSGRDFIQIMDAVGYIDPLTLYWEGSKGRVTWERVGMPDTEMYALLGNYRINLKTPTYKADSVVFHYPILFEGEVMGKLEDKVTMIQNLRQVAYPKFVSYENSFRIKDFAPGLNYQGGLSVEGANLLGSGVGSAPAVVEIFSEDTLRVRMTADRIVMNGRYIRSPESEVIIYFGGDSIYHPNLVFNYDVGQEQMRLNRSEHYTSQGPYADSYHNIDMNFDELLWNRGESSMKLQALQGTSIGKATFESNTFFNEQFYMSLQGMSSFHPLVSLATYSRYVGGRDFNVVNYAHQVGYDLYQVKHMLMALAKLGFVYFDEESDAVLLRQKLFDFIQSTTRQRDYDVIRFNSRTQGEANAELNLKTRDLKIRGIPVIFLSDSQNVRLVPRENSIIMKRNRSFQFDGVVDAGLFRFTGSNFFFQYDSFKINLQNIDSLQLSIETGKVNQYNEPILARIDNAIEHVTGELLIDHPGNKSGLASYPQYPSFTSRGNSFIYFDSPSIQHGVYDRQVFYFELEPFSFDSLDNFNPEAIAPEGTFVSAGILPPLEMEMTLRKDNSLGFYMQAPEEGIGLYGGTGKFYEDIEMSSRGLHGYGSFDYLTSTTWSDDFLMHPDSMMARSRRFLIREKVSPAEYPYVENTEADIILMPDQQCMRVERVKETFRIFNDSIFHAGDLFLRPSGLSGDGVMALTEARLASRNFRFGSRIIMADSAGVQIKEKGDEEFTFLTDDINLLVDLRAGRGEFSARGDQTRVEFPYNLYETNLDRMIWYMDGGKVGLSQKRRLPGNTVDIGIDSLTTNGPAYTSLHPRQDGLSFVAPEATYNYRSRQLNAHRVPFIEVADAIIFPDSGEVEVGYQATMSQLNHSRVLADRYNKYHRVYDATIGVNGARDYLGSGYYDYHDAFGNGYQLFFDRIWVDSTNVTRAGGKVDPESPFMLSPQFDFKGAVNMTASRSNLEFDGGVKIMHECRVGRDWLRFTAVIDPNDIRIPVGEQMLNTDLNKIFAGSLITRDSTHIYSTFLSGRKDYFDRNITSASGELIYDPEREAYLLSIPGKLADTTKPGNYLRFETANCQLYGEGPLDLTLEYGQVRLTTAGNALHRIGEGLFTARVVMGLDFFFSDEALQVMGSEIDSLPDLEPVDLTSHFYQLALRDLLGETQARNLERQLALTGMYEEIPASLKHTIFFNDLPLRWNQETRSFRCNGKVGIGNIGNIQVNKKVDAYIELVEKGSGDIFDMYLKVDRNTWYYIAYSPGGLQVLSSNKRFNDIVFNLKAADRRSKAKLGQAQYVYSLAAQRRMDLFIDRFLEYEDDR
jgi:hypothetical protein